MPYRAIIIAWSNILGFHIHIMKWAIYYFMKSWNLLCCPSPSPPTRHFNVTTTTWHSSVQSLYAEKSIFQQNLRQQNPWKPLPLQFWTLFPLLLLLLSSTEFIGKIFCRYLISLLQRQELPVFGAAGCASAAPPRSPVTLKKTHASSLLFFLKLKGNFFFFFGLLFPIFVKSKCNSAIELSISKLNLIEVICKWDC